MDQEIRREKTTFELAAEFYITKIDLLVKELEQSNNLDNFSLLIKTEDIEEYRLKLKQLNRRHELGFIT